MHQELKSRARSADDESPNLGLLIAIPIVVGAMLVIAYIARFSGHPAGDPDSWGQFGDFVGGLLNPVVGSITIFLLVRTLVEQKQELQHQRRAIFLQGFEQTFFTWLSDYRNIITSTASAHADMTGLQSISFNLRRDTKKKHTLIIELGYCVQGQLNLGVISKTAHIHACTAEWYLDALGPSRHDLETALRTLYTLLQWVDKQQDLTFEQKWTYISIARARLSAQELEILFCNSLTDDGKAFTPLIDKYALLDNLPQDLPGILEFVRLHADPFSPASYASDVARRMHESNKVAGTFSVGQNGSPDAT